MMNDDTEQSLLDQQNEMINEFKQGLDISPLTFDSDAKKFVVPASEERASKVVALKGEACSEKALIFLALYTAFYSAYVLGKGNKSVRTYVSYIVPNFIDFLNNIEITTNNRANVLKIYEAHRVKNDGVKTQSSGLKELIYLINFALEYELFGVDVLSNEEYRYLDLLTKTKPAASDDSEQNTLTGWFGFHLWLRRDDLGIGNDLFNRIASPKLLVKSFRITIETGLLELHHAKHELIETFKELGLTRDSFPTLEPKPVAKDYLNGRSDPSFKKDNAQHKSATLKYKQEFFRCLSSSVKPFISSKRLEVGIDALIYSQCTYQVISDVKMRFNQSLHFSKQTTINGKIETVFRQGTPHCLLFTLEFILELLDYANSAEPTVSVPVCRAEHYLFACLMAHQTVAVSDIFRLKLSNFKFLMRQNKKITYIESDYFKSRSHAVHNTEMISAKTLYGKAILAFISDRTAGYLIKDEPLVMKEGIINFKTGSSSFAAIFFRFLAESSLRKSIEDSLLKQGGSSVFVDAVNKVFSCGVNKETFSNRNKGNNKNWLDSCDTPCSGRLFGYEHIKNTSVHSHSDTFDPTTIVNYRSHTNETERLSYLSKDNETWKNNCGRITRSVMNDIQVNVLRPSESDKTTFHSDFIKAVEFIEQRKSDILARLKVVSQRAGGRVDELGFDINRKIIQGDLPDSMYLVESPETVMKLKHFLTELEYKHFRISQNAPGFLFYTALPTAEWIEAVFSQRMFSHEVVRQGEEMYKKYREHLPPLFVAQIGAV